MSDRPTWYLAKFDPAWVICRNNNCKSEFTRKSIAGKRKCPKCKIDNYGCRIKAKEERKDE